MVSLPFGVKEVMYYAAAAQWVMLCREPSVALTGTFEWSEDRTGGLNPLSKTSSRSSGSSTVRCALSYADL